MDESVRAINTDIQAFKNIRTQLFQRESATKKKMDGEKYFIYFFHIFESVVNNTSNLVSKYSSHLISQCPKDV
jgi:radical SAM superfamily enzyme